MDETRQVLTQQMLAERFRTGDGEAFRQLHAQVHNDLLAFITSRCPRGTDAEAMAQTVWVRVWSHRCDFANISFRGWIFQIAKNLLTDAYRQQGRRPKSESWGDRDLAELIRENQSDRIEALRDCLKSVGSEFVRVLRLQIDGLTANDIAEQMGISMGTVFSRASRGRDQLRDCIERTQK